MAGGCESHSEPKLGQFELQGRLRCPLLGRRIDMLRAAMKIAALLCAGVMGFGLRGCILFNHQTTVTSLSPNENYRVTLVERRLDIDRNFELKLENLASHTITTVFHSPDEGRPIGSERIVWSVDDSRFLLLGRHFYATDASQLPSGEQA